MLVLDAALESPQQPPFEQGGDFVDAWHDLVSRSRSCRGRGHAAAPGRSPRSSGWSRTTSPGTMSAAACGSLRKSCRRSPRSPCDMPGTAASHRPFPTARRQLHSVGSKSPPASGAGGYRRGRQPHPETTRPAPGRCLGSQRPPPDAFRPPSVHSISRIGGAKGIPTARNFAAFDPAEDAVGNQRHIRLLLPLDHSIATIMLPFLPEQIEQWPIARLKPYARNARTHSDDQIAKIAASLVEYGWTAPVLVGGRRRDHRRPRPDAGGAAARASTRCR